MNFAYINNERQVTVCIKGSHRTLTAPDVMFSDWSVGAKPQTLTHSWPTWSPDGKYIACFRVGTGAEAHARVFVTDKRGLTATEAAILNDHLPIYLSWSPDGTQIASVSQHEGELQLYICDAQRPDSATATLSGSPLFFTWTVPQRLVAFIGGGGPDAQLLDIDLSVPDEAPMTIPGSPGDFCTPIHAQDSLFYVQHINGAARVTRWSSTDEASFPVEDLDGLVALLASPCQRWVARAVAPKGDATPYEGLAVIDVVTGTVTELCNLQCMAFFWIPEQSALLVARHDPERKVLEWYRVGLDGFRTHLADCQPSRDLLFYLRFFEQYAESHSIISPDGSQALIGGSALGTPHDPRSPNLYTMDLTTGILTEIGPGAFGVWAP